MMSSVSPMAYAFGKKESVTLFELPGGAKIETSRQNALRRFTNRFIGEKTQKAYGKELLHILRDCSCEVMSRLPPDDKDALKPKNIVVVLVPDDAFLDMSPAGTFELARPAIHDRVALPCSDGAFYIPHPSKSLDKNHDLGRNLHKHLRTLAGTLSQRTKKLRKEVDDERFNAAKAENVRILHPNRRDQQLREQVHVRPRGDARRVAAHG